MPRLLAHITDGAGVPTWWAIYGVIASAALAAYAVTSSRVAEAELAPDRDDPPKALLWRTLLGSLFLVAIVVLIVFAARGDQNPLLNPTARVVFVGFWGLLLVGTGILGDWWREIGPAAALDRWPKAESRPLLGPTAFVPALVLFSFVWINLAWPETWAPTPIAVWLAVHLAWLVIGTVARGGQFAGQWDPFLRLARVLAAGSPVGRDEEGRMGIRSPLAGLRSVDWTPGTLAVVAVASGAIATEALYLTPYWIRVQAGRTGWDRVGPDTVALLFFTAVLAVAALAAAEVTNRPSYAASTAALAPLLWGSTLALLGAEVIVSIPITLRRLSDPFNSGRDLLGVSDWTATWDPAPGVVSAFELAGVFAAVAGSIVASRPTTDEGSWTLVPFAALAAASGIGMLVMIL